jgi:cytosine/adenosine deaminase-related metal-dependent hydrolase
MSADARDGAFIDPSSSEVDLRVSGGTVLDLRAETCSIADVYVDAGRIVSVGGPERPARRTLDANGMAVMPAMHDLHDHLRDMTPGTSAGEGLALDQILRFYWRLMELAGPTEYEVMAAFNSARLVKSGITSVVDHVYPFHRPGLTEATVRGYERSGVRWFLARGLMTKGHEPICESIEAALGDMRRALDNGVPAERLLPAPVSFRQAIPSDYRAARAFADECGLRLYTHVAETAAELDMTMGEFGKRPVELLHDLGFTGNDVTLVHCVLLSDDEIAMLAETGTHVVHCPTNHMKLAKGYTRVPDLLAAGVNVCLGIDQMVDLIREARQEVLLQSVRYSDPGAVTPGCALRMATENGAKALGLEDVGVIEPGAVADLVCIDLNRLHIQPVLDPIWSVVHRGQGTDVAHVVIDGTVAVEDHTLVSVDEEALTEEALSVIDHYLALADLPPLHAVRP